jgi:hypothetical protein
MAIGEELFSEIAATRDAYDRLLEIIPEKAYALPSDNPARQNWFYRLIPRVVPKNLFDWLNKHLTRCGARHLPRDFLSNEYEKAHFDSHAQPTTELANKKC